MVRKPAEKEIVHSPEEYDFPDSLYQDHWEGAEAYGVVSDAGEMMACIEVCPEEWSNRLLVTELWVSDALRGKGIGKRLMDKAKEVALRQKRRAIILETQSCNTNAINKGRLIIDSFHVSRDYRHRGIGRALFEAARQEALKMGAHALYASCCSSEETINFYSAMGFRLSSDPIPSLAEAEPYDLQMECMIVQEMQ